MSNDIEKKEEMSKEELVYVVSLMLDCQSYAPTVNKLTKPCLFKIYDSIHARGVAFTHKEDETRRLNYENLTLEGKVLALEAKVQLLSNKLRNEINKKRKGSHFNG